MYMDLTFCFSDIWIELWSSSSSESSNSMLGYWLGLYAGFSAIQATALSLAV